MVMGWGAVLVLVVSLRSLRSIFATLLLSERESVKSFVRQPPLPRTATAVSPLPAEENLFSFFLTLSALAAPDAADGDASCDRDCDCGLAIAAFMGS